MSNWPRDSGLYCSLGLKRDLDGNIFISRPTLASLHDWQLSQPLYGGHLSLTTDARDEVSAAFASELTKIVETAAVKRVFIFITSSCRMWQVV